VLSPRPTAGSERGTHENVSLRCRQEIKDSREAEEEEEEEEGDSLCLTLHVFPRLAILDVLNIH